MALMNAAMSSEIALHRLVRPRLEVGEVTSNDAKELTNRMPVPQLLTLLRFLKLATQEQCEGIREAYTARNKIVHGAISPAGITREQAERAISRHSVNERAR